MTNKKNNNSGSVSEQKKKSVSVAAGGRKGHTAKKTAKAVKFSGSGKSQKTVKKAAKSVSSKTAAAKTQKSQKVASSSKKSPQPSKKGASVKIIPLGGLGEIGKNLTVYEYKNDIIIVDCGMSFPNADMLGVDAVIPDFSYLRANSAKIKGLIITHGHEDHIGAVPYLLHDLDIPVYATALTIGLIKYKLQEHHLLDVSHLNVIKPGSTFKLGAFQIEAIHVNHSIPDAVAFAITTPAGVIVQTGDFKIDTTPILSRVIDLPRFAEIGKKGVLALLMDSTNATRSGVTMSESTVGNSFSHLFKDEPYRRIIIATFSSNIHRIQQIINEASASKRKVCVVGRSMENVVDVAQELGYLKVPQNTLISIDRINDYPDNKMVVVTTGSQGEPMSALYRMASGDHKKVKVGPNDLIIVSATPIPGNEKMVTSVINKLLKYGAKVIYEKMYDVHVSGHACQEELKLMLSLIKPKFFIPVHGEQMHLSKNSELGKMLGIPKDNILIADNGNVIELTAKNIKITGDVTAGAVLIDGFGVGDVGERVLGDRKRLGESGIVLVTLAFDDEKQLVSGPEVVSRGFVLVNDNKEMMEQAKDIVREIAEKYSRGFVESENSLKNTIRDKLSSYFFEQMKRRPMVLTVILYV